MSDKNKEPVFYGYANSLDGPRATYPVDQLAAYNRAVEKLTGRAPVHASRAEDDTDDGGPSATA